MTFNDVSIMDNHETAEPVEQTILVEPQAVLQAVNRASVTAIWVWGIWSEEVSSTAYSTGNVLLV